MIKPKINVIPQTPIWWDFVFDMSYYNDPRFLIEEELSGEILECTDTLKTLLLFIYCNFHYIPFNGIDIKEENSNILLKIEKIKKSKGVLWWRKSWIEEIHKYYPKYSITLQDSFKIGILNRFFIKSSPCKWELKDEFIGKIVGWRSFIESYLYCLNFLDWPDIDYWAEETLKLLLKE